MTRRRAQGAGAPIPTVAVREPLIPLPRSDQRAPDAPDVSAPGRALVSADGP